MILFFCLNYWDFCLRVHVALENLPPPYLQGETSCLTLKSTGEPGWDSRAAPWIVLAFVMQGSLTSLLHWYKDPSHHCYTERCTGIRSEAAIPSVQRKTAWGQHHNRGQSLESVRNEVGILIAWRMPKSNCACSLCFLRGFEVSILFYCLTQFSYTLSKFSLSES